MNKYELALVVSAKIEDDARTAVVEKAKEYITRAGGTVTEVEEAGKKRLAYEIQHMTEAHTQPLVDFVQHASYVSIQISPVKFHHQQAYDSTS